jgi:hypothetical protein
VLLRWASELDAVDAQMTALVTPEVLREIVARIPEPWLIEGGGQRDRDVYLNYLLQRRASSRVFVEEAERARALLV